MRKLVTIGIVATAALTAAGIAVAHLAATGTTSVTATFSATTAEGVKNRTCSGPDGDYQLLNGSFRGTAASSDANLAGDVRVRINSAYNTTEKVGWANGWMRLHNARVLRFDAVNTNGKLTGLLHGSVGGAGSLVGSFTADLTTSGLSNVQIGGGSAIPNVALLAGRICTGPPPGKSVKLTVKGTIEAITQTSVSVKPEDGSSTQTCALSSSSPSVSGLSSGQRVEMSCATLGSTLTVVRLKKRG
jgi:hypothetical protein